MAVKFLTEDWANEVEDALNSHQGFKAAIANADLALQNNISDAPQGEVGYYMKTSGGAAEFEFGTIDNPDVTIGQNYETASAIFKGELNVQAAFMTGKLKVTGNLAKLMMHQAAIQQMQAALKDLDVEYRDTEN